MWPGRRRGSDTPEAANGNTSASSSSSSKCLSVGKQFSFGSSGNNANVNVNLNANLASNCVVPNVNAIVVGLQAGERKYCET